MLALQGDVVHHVRFLELAGATVSTVRRVRELDDVDALVIPGGESSVIDKLARATGLMQPLRERVAAGMPAFGTCAGMIMLADRVQGAIEGQQSVGGLDVTVQRNAFGRQVDSFEADLEIAGIASTDDPFRGVFIRAPWVEQVGPDVEVLAHAPGEQAHPVVVRQGRLLATSFHPELTGDSRLHRAFLRLAGSRTSG